MALRLLITAAFLASVTASADLPAPPKASDLADFPMTWTPDPIGAFDAAPLLDKPAGRLGPVVVKGAHFYTGDKRIKFWGVNLAFSANFPTHEQADRVAARLAHFGVNAVRFHHMDNQRFPNGLFADAKFETLSEEAMDRLDYFIAALKKHGVYSNINLHVSRHWSKAHNFENADKLPESYDKIVDIFHPEIIAANKRFARDMMSHVNKYTGNSYASEPAVCMVEINNEDTLFLWGGEQAIAKLPEPYAGMLNGLWNKWLAKKYETREKLAAAWAEGAQPLGATNLLAGTWAPEAHGGAAMTPKRDGPTITLDVTKTGPNDWNAQYGHPKLKLEKGKFYTLTFTAHGDKPRKIGLGASQAHAPWQNLGLIAQPSLTTGAKPYRFGFTATEDDDNARISFTVGQSTGVVTLSDIQLREGGQEGLQADESPIAAAAGSVPVATHKPGDSVTASRKADWFTFLHQTDEAYWVDMRNFLRDDLKVQAPITGSIGIGPLGTLSQTRMDFVDAHAYWDHPRFPGKGWDPRNWLIDNKAMVDNPAGATLWKLAAIRAAGKPFTVTEYNHGHPNDWQAETIPLIATFAALQDWDAVFMFAYSHSAQFEREAPTSYFDIEANPAKMPMMPVGARIFLGGAVQPLAESLTVKATMPDMLKHASPSYYDAWRFIGLATDVKWDALLKNRFAVEFPGSPAPQGREAERPRVAPPLWTSGGKPGTGQFQFRGDGAHVFVGFGPLPLESGASRAPVNVTALDTPFAAVVVVPADPSKSLTEADRLLICAAARAENTGMKWNDKRTTVSTDWGKAPTRIEPVKATLSLPADYTVRALDMTGKIIHESKTENKTLKLGNTPTLWYELIRN
ncbi:MAG: carbohydrate binding domain-containing protein [Phycisphaerae bacterium]|nr:carbohydrate binding domain-containing protein [Tepidisphaeraceae bacterium]